ncbi:hypothetical protein GCM10020331_041750 [Ectobacillus funiculus]
MQSYKNCLFLGAGSIAEAVIAGLLEANLVKGQDITVSNRSNTDRLSYFKSKYDVNGTHDKKNFFVMPILSFCYETKKT